MDYCSENGVFWQNLGVGIGIGVGIEVSVDSDLDSESDPDPCDLHSARAAFYSSCPLPLQTWQTPLP